MNYSLNVKSSSIVHTLLSNCVKLLGKVQKLLIKCISYSVISKRIRVVSPKFYTARKNFTGPPVPTVLTNSKSVGNSLRRRLACVRAEEEKLKLMLQLDEVQLRLKSAEFSKPATRRIRKLNDETGWFYLTFSFILENKSERKTHLFKTRWR